MQEEWTTNGVQGAARLFEALGRISGSGFDKEWGDKILKGAWEETKNSKVYWTLECLFLSTVVMQN